MSDLGLDILQVDDVDFAEDTRFPIRLADTPGWLYATTSQIALKTADLLFGDLTGFAGQALIVNEYENGFDFHLFGDMFGANNLSELTDVIAARAILEVYSALETDAAIAAAVVGLWDLKTVIDCSANPNYPAALKGDVHVVSVAGKIGGGAGITVESGDAIVAMADNAGGTQAAVGASWTIVQNNIIGAYYAGGTDVAVADGGTGSSTAGGARANLGVNTRTAVMNLISTALSASEVLGVLSPPTGETWTIAGNFVGSTGLKISGGTNPAATYTIDVKKNGASVGTISISNAGVVTFSTTSGAAIVLTSADELQFVGNATPDTAVGYVFTIYMTWA